MPRSSARIVEDLVEVGRRSRITRVTAPGFPCSAPLVHQRKMLRSMVGWYRVEGDAWSDMKSRVQSALRAIAGDGMVGIILQYTAQFRGPYCQTFHCLPRTEIQLAIAISQHSRKESLADRPPKGWDDDLTCFECAFLQTLGMMPLIR